MIYLGEIWPVLAAAFICCMVAAFSAGALLVSQIPSDSPTRTIYKTKLVYVQPPPSQPRRQEGVRATAQTKPKEGHAKPEQDSRQVVQRGGSHHRLSGARQRRSEVRSHVLPRGNAGGQRPRWTVLLPEHHQRRVHGRGWRAGRSGIELQDRRSRHLHYKLGGTVQLRVHPWRMKNTSSRRNNSVSLSAFTRKRSPTTSRAIFRTWTR